ncbi:diacylglycerol/lipid kinase family protein [Zunongwangia atlantica]|uniref:Diacylglycerol kinase catalytic subunit n=1 Tax=Zunongwangia atlantica 22II14-10F7 TaxID=1185767 RepID=A0A1Y1T4R7_9FLAO|nr:diacylglycerol kinase family protein [Zunongwangia atlantica]ORL45584.1 diacylglycerol kinase catalytic subunit [Zunongwangia atlantica 22II14-10F7]
MADFRNILMVVNPISGGEEKDDLIKEVRRAVEQNNCKFHLFKTKGENDIKKIKAEIDKTSPERVLVVGGDGTVKIVAEALFDKDLPIAIFPAGSANGLALNLGIPEKRKQQIEVALGDNFTSLDVLQINDELCLHLSDIGLNAELIKNYESASIRGKFGYLMQSIPTLIKSKYPYEYEVEVNGETFYHKGIMLAIANCTKYGTGAKINPEGKHDDGKFEIVIFKNLDITEILGTLREDVKFDPAFAETISTEQAIIKCKKPIAFQIDGEFIENTQKIAVKIAEKDLKIAVK